MIQIMIYTHIHTHKGTYIHTQTDRQTRLIHNKKEHNNSVLSKHLRTFLLTLVALPCLP